MVGGFEQYRSLKKISYVMNVLNGEPFIIYQLQSIYAHAHEIIIVEGAYLKFAFATNNGRSQDSTLQSIKNFPDPENKVKLIVKEGFYDDRMEMCNEFMHHVTGDIIWQIDADEFYHNYTHIYVRDLFRSDSELDLVSFNFIDLFGSLKLQTDGLEGTSLQDVRRVHRFSPGDLWINQRPPILGNLQNEAKVLRKVIRGVEMERNGHLMFNLTMLFDKQIQDKFLYYQSKDFTGPMTDWYEKSIRTFENQFNMLNFEGHLTYLTELKASLPEVCNEIEKECSEKTSYAFINDSEHLRKVREPAYMRAVSTAYEINTLSQQNLGLMRLTYTICRISVNIFSNFEPSSRAFVFSVLSQKTLASYKRILGGWLKPSRLKFSN